MSLLLNQFPTYMQMYLLILLLLWFSWKKTGCRRSSVKTFTLSFNKTVWKRQRWFSLIPTSVRLFDNLSPRVSLKIEGQHIVRWQLLRLRLERLASVKFSIALRVLHNRRIDSCKKSKYWKKVETLQGSVYSSLFCKLTHFRTWKTVSMSDMIFLKSISECDTYFFFVWLVLTTWTQSKLSYVCWTDFQNTWLLMFLFWVTLGHCNESILTW